MPEPTEVRPTTNPPKAPIAIAISLSRVESMERRVARVRLDERLREEAEPAEDQRAADDLLERVHVLVGDLVRELDADEGQRRRPEEHPAREPGVHGAEHPVARGAEGLEDRAVEDVGADRDLRVEAEEAGSGSASSGCRRPSRSSRRGSRRSSPASENCQVMRPRGGSGQETNGLPVSRQPSL